MNRTEEINLPIINQDGYSPVILQGLQLLNGRTDGLSIQAAKENLTPYYDIPHDDSTWTQSRERAICFIVADYINQECFQEISSSYTDINNRNNNHDVAVLSRMEGLGTRGNKEELYHMIIPKGLINKGNKNNTNNLFNIQTAGSATFSNYGPNKISAGDILIIDFPDVEKRSYERNGKELHVKPYNPSIHGMTAKSIRDCLESDDNITNSYHPKFKELCKNYFDSKLKEFMVFKLFYDKLSNLKSDLETLFEDNGDLLSMNENYYEHLFHSGNQDLYGLFIDLFFPKSATNIPDLNDEKSNFNKIHKSTLPTQIIMQAEFINILRRFIFGKAHTSAAPGEDFTIQLGNFSL